MPKIPKEKDLYIKKKRRFLAKMMQEGELKSRNAWLSIHSSSKELLATYESEGLVVSLNGSGTLKQDHPVCQQASKLSLFVMEQGGIVMNGGRSSGVMQSSSEIARDKALGVIFPELKKEAAKKSPLVILNSPQPRIEVLATCAPIIVIFRGGLGTLNILMRAIVHTKNRQYHPEQPPQMVFISNYWIGLLYTLLNLGCLPQEFLEELFFFNTVDEVIEKIPKIEA